MAPSPLKLAAAALWLGMTSGAAQAQIVITDGAIIAPNDPVYHNQDVIIRGCQVTINGPQSFNSLTLERSSFGAALVTHDPNFSFGGVSGMFLTIAGDLIINGDESGQPGLNACRLDVSGQGYPSGQGPGKSSDTPITGSPAGASHAGEGGVGRRPSASTDWTPYLPGSGYGSIEHPTLFGSGAGRLLSPPNPPIPSGAGGGCIRLVVGGQTRIDGQLSANGGTRYPAGSGGSGGSVFITTTSLAGSGLIRAQGGLALGPVPAGATGGGGRIAIHWTSGAFDGTISASGGPAVFVQNVGGAGTIYLAKVGQTPEIIIDNEMGGPPSPAIGSTLLVTPADAFDGNLSLRNRARLGPPIGFAAPQHITVTGELNIDPTSILGGSGRGPRPAPAGNGGDANLPTTTQGGGGHGGAGGHGMNANPPLGIAGAQHGNPNAPVSFGGAGGASGAIPGGRGGSALRLTVGGPINLYGAISNDGEGRPGDIAFGSAGAGAGGSLWIETPGIVGSGFITAMGGHGARDGGGGGGGRILIDTCVLGLFPKQLSADAGSADDGNAEAGHPGTIVIRGATTDWNNDGVVNSTDVSSFINDWFTDQAKGSTVTDFNGDGVSNSTDVSDFINAWFAEEAAC